MISMSAYGYYVLKDEYYMPSSLGGSGDYSLVFSKHPYAKHVPYLKEYYIMVTSYHLS